MPKMVVLLAEAEKESIENMSQPADMEESATHIILTVNGPHKIYWVKNAIGILGTN